MTTSSLYQLMEVWVIMWDQESIELSLLELASQFEQKKVRFLLFDKINDVLDFISNPQEPMTTNEKIQHFQNLLYDKGIQQVAEFVRVENSGSPDYTLTVLNIEEAIAKFPMWFKEFKGMAWDDFVTHIGDSVSDDE
jgi:hypothetical protein